MKNGRTICRSSAHSQATPPPHARRDFRAHLRVLLLLVVVVVVVVITVTISITITIIMIIIIHMHLLIGSLHTPWTDLEVSAIRTGKVHITANLPTNIVDFRGFDSSTILIIRGGIPRPKGIS